MFVCVRVYVSHFVHIVPHNMGAKQIHLVWVNYNDLTATSLGPWLNKGNHPQMALIQISELLQFTVPRFSSMCHLWHGPDRTISNGDCYPLVMSKNCPNNY